MSLFWRTPCVFPRCTRYFSEEGKQRIPVGASDVSTGDNRGGRERAQGDGSAPSESKGPHGVGVEETTNESSAAGVGARKLCINQVLLNNESCAASTQHRSSFTAQRLHSQTNPGTLPFAAGWFPSAGTGCRPSNVAGKDTFANG